MSRNLIFCFDGTGKEPADATQSERKDSNISNVLKLHLLFGGDLRNLDSNDRQFLWQQGRFPDRQISLYYSGVGTYGSKIKRLFNAALAYKDVGRIIREARSDLEQRYETGDRIFVFGFSRGAAIARKFASVIGREAPKRKVHFLGVFDTVASIGMPDLGTSEQPASDVIFENRQMAPSVRQALHLCSMDDKRRVFQPTLFNRDPRIDEIWFAGAHSDVGGGYELDGLSDLTLRFMLDELDRRNLGIQQIAASEIRYEQLGVADEDGDLGFEDVIVEPSALGFNHQQERIWPISAFTLYDRDVAVIENDKITRKPPLIHPSAIERLHADPEYRPASLKNRRHRLWQPDGSVSGVYNGMSQHLHRGAPLMHILKKGESVLLPVFAHAYHNRTHLMLEAGASYRFKARAQPRWYDGGIPCGPDGWDRKSQNLSWLKELAIGKSEPYRRHPGAKWFCLIGSIGTDDKELFEIGATSTRYTAPVSGEFCPFANDLRRMYFNNGGRIMLKVERLS